MDFYEIALSLVPGIGDVLGKKLISYCGCAEAVFKENKKLLRKIPRVGENVLVTLSGKEIFLRAEKEMTFIERYKIQVFSFRDKDYPYRLLNCIDSPIILYYKGTGNLNHPKVIGIVGTRTPTDYGKEICNKLISGLVEQQIFVVSGLAYGIDTCAHKTALDNGLHTAAVLGHGLDRIYPFLNKTLAEKIISQGGLVTDFPSQTEPDRENFPKRNRIIAGLCDAVIVVEAAKKGGALITADIANSYNRDVFAIPGRIGDLYSEGTNALIRMNKASLIQSHEDILYLLGWDPKVKKPDLVQRKIFIEMTPEEKILVDILSGVQKIGIDELSLLAGLRMSVVSAALLNLEFEGVVNSLPGKLYSLV
jgi:DNA processing protein